MSCFHHIIPENLQLSLNPKDHEAIAIVKELHDLLSEVLTASNIPVSNDDLVSEIADDVPQLFKPDVTPDSFENNLRIIYPNLSKSQYHRIYKTFMMIKRRPIFHKILN